MASTHKKANAAIQRSETARIFISSRKQCPFQCQYCFANFESYNGQELGFDDLKNLSTSPTKTTILYPYCDTEPTLTPKETSQLLDFFDQQPTPKIVSISTKGLITGSKLDALIRINERLHTLGGFLKVSISIATLNSIQEIEPGTASFEVRLQNLQLLKQENIATSVNLKPLLPEISFGEYISAIDACIPHTNLFMLGSLYLEATPENSNALVLEKEVKWLKDGTRWMAAEDRFKISAIKKHIESYGARAFDSDEELLRMIMSEKH